MRPVRIAALLLPLLTSAGAAADTLERVMACRTVTAPAARLACFDAATAAAAPPATAAPPAVGSEQLILTPPEGAPDRLRAVITDLRRDQDGRWLFTLDNGQVWLQREDDPLRIGIGETVTVRPGAFGSYSMVPDSRPTRIKVRRVQ
ncbi:hypothetical protein [Rhodocista pekingensis]|uniref:Uncharacterized protein n=1 Tax=Rhodocista pekingensis TaxID=201185 RepID=A0ABW2KY96_9PROT